MIHIEKGRVGLSARHDLQAIATILFLVSFLVYSMHRALW